MYDFKPNELIDSVLYNKHKIKSWWQYRKLLHKIKKISPDYTTLETIYDFIDQLNYAYFYCLDKDNRLFIGNSRYNKKKVTDKSLLYKDDSVTITLILKPDETITMSINRHMGYKETEITFKNGEADKYINNSLEAQLFMNCTNIIMDELHYIVKKYRRFRRVKW